MRGDEILDGSWQHLGTLTDVRNEIDGATGATTLAALWYYFVR